ncbi:MAG: PAS domain S-box protein [Acidimicrobiia bacterium]|nr:PAS domain S-box protein [Acidimicrobiia bacterium]
MDPTPQTTTTALDRLDETIVRFTTSISAVFFLAVVAAFAVSRDPLVAFRAISPGVVAGTGVVMLWRRQPRTVFQLTSGAATLVAYAGFVDVDSRSGAVLGLLSIGLVGALMVRRRVAIFMVLMGSLIWIVAFWWNLDVAGTNSALVESLSPVLMFLFTGSLVAWLKGELIGEMSAHRQAANELSVSEERFRRAFDVAAAGVALVDVVDGRILAINEAGCELVGYTEGDLTTMNIGELTHPDDREASRERFIAVATGKEPFDRSTLRYLRRDGSIAYALVSTALVRSAVGDPLHVVAHVVDTTEQMAAEQRLVELLASKDELIASVSHELRTPLTAVVGYAEILRDQRDALSVDERDEIIGSIVGQGSDLADIVEDLLVAARSEDDGLRVRSEPVHLRSEAMSALQSLSRHDAVVGTEVAGQDVVAFGDPVRVRQIIRNLVSNAVRYGGPSIRLGIDSDGSRARLVVIDDGVGVPPDERRWIFEPYHRSHPQKGLTAAVGLGLTVARKLARLMDGELTYRYEENESLFELTLPAVPVGQQPASSPTVEGLAAAPTA